MGFIIFCKTYKTIFLLQYMNIYMNCNNEIHKYFIENGDLICPFCCENMMEDDELRKLIAPQNNLVKNIPCCENQKLYTMIKKLFVKNVGVFMDMNQQKNT